MTVSWNVAVMLDTKELTLVYELLHDVKISYARKEKGNKHDLQACNKVMEKIENMLLRGEDDALGRQPDKKQS